MEPSTHLPDLDFGLKMRFTKGDVASFFRTDEDDPALLERRALIAAEEGWIVFISSKKRRDVAFGEAHFQPEV